MNLKKVMLSAAIGMITVAASGTIIYAYEPVGSSLKEAIVYSQSESSDTVTEDIIEEEQKEVLTATQESIITAAYQTPCPGMSMCATWVSNVYKNAGVGITAQDANSMWASYCTRSISEIEPGMIIAVNQSSDSGMGAYYGHTGIYIGDGMVIHSRTYYGYGYAEVEVTTLAAWLEMYNYDGSAACGYTSDAYTRIENEKAELEKEAERAEDADEFKAKARAAAYERTQAARAALIDSTSKLYLEDLVSAENGIVKPVLAKVALATAEDTAED